MKKRTPPRGGYAVMSVGGLFLVNLTDEACNAMIYEAGTFLRSEATRAVKRLCQTMQIRHRVVPPNVMAREILREIHIYQGRIAQLERLHATIRRESR